MKRRNFIKTSAIAYAGFQQINPFSLGLGLFKDQIVGHNDFQYKIDLDWGTLDKSEYPVKDCHEMVIDSKGRIILLTNHTKNNILIYNKRGDIVDSWGTTYPGAHGLTLNAEGGEDFLYIADTSLHEIIKTTLSGKVVMRIPYPVQTGLYDSPDEYIPTETCIAANGDIYVADGYGKQFILHYNRNGELLNYFGGRGSEDSKFDNAHGICIDTRDDENPILLITARMQNKLKRFSLDGQYLNAIDLPGAYICRPVIHNDNIYLATIWSGDGQEGTGFISILDKHNKLVSAPGGSKPIYENGQLRKMHQTIRLFIHPHDVCIDDEENIYVAQWNANQCYPIKLKRI